MPRANVRRDSAPLPVHSELPPEVSAPPPGGSAAPPDEALLLPADDPFPADGSLDLAGLARRWEAFAARPAMTAEEMRGADRRAQLMGVPGRQLMEQAGAAVATAARALLVTTGRWGRGPVLVLAGPGNNGGDGSVAARYLAAAGARVAVVLVASEARPTTPEGAWAWDALSGQGGVERIHVAQPRDVNVLAQGVEKAGLVVDALLGTGVHGELREPIRSAVELAARARAHGVPVLSVDAPTALDLTSGDPSNPVVRADVTVTFHRPKAGLRSRAGRACAGVVLVAPIGIPAGADPF